MKGRLVFIGLVLSLLLCFSAYAAVEWQQVELKDVSKVPASYAKMVNGKVVFGHSATAYDGATLNKILSGYDVTLQDAGKVPKSFAKDAGGKVAFGGNSVAYDAGSLNKIFEGYGLKLTPENVGKVPKSFAKKNASGDVVFGGSAIAYDPETLNQIITAYQKSVEVAEAATPEDADGDGIADKFDQCPNTPKGVKVDAKGCPLDSDGDGVPDHLDKCPGTQKNTEVDQWGCPAGETPRSTGMGVDSDADGVPDSNDNCPNTPKGAKVDSRGCWTLENIQFDYNKSKVKKEYYPILDEAASVMKANPDLKIEIQGHTCDIGSQKFNLGLSERRANAVKKYFLKKGIPGFRMTTIGFGKTKPLVPNTDEEHRKKNRRVELKPIK